MVLNNALQPSGKLLAELFRELCGITKIIVIDISTFFAMIVSIRPRTRLAVSRFASQIGLSNS
jgi:hypothetical protein